VKIFFVLFLIFFSDLSFSKSLNGVFIHNDIMNIVDVENKKNLIKVNIANVKKFGFIEKVNILKKDLYLFEVKYHDGEKSKHRIIKREIDGTATKFLSGWGLNIITGTDLIYYIDEASGKPRLVNFSGNIIHDINDKGEYRRGAYFQTNIAQLVQNKIMFTRGFSNALGVFNIDTSQLTYNSDLRRFRVDYFSSKHTLISDELGYYFLYDFVKGSFKSILPKLKLNLIHVQDNFLYGTETRFSLLKMSEHREVIKVGMHDDKIVKLGLEGFGRFISFLETKKY